MKAAEKRVRHALHMLDGHINDPRPDFGLSPHDSPRRLRIAYLLMEAAWLALVASERDEYNELTRNLKKASKLWGAMYE